MGIQPAPGPACRDGHPFPRYLAYRSTGSTYCAECVRLRRREWRLRTFGPPGAPDPIAVERAIAGDPPERLNTRERRTVVTHLTARGLSAAEIARLARCTPRQVHRIRAAAA